MRKTLLGVAVVAVLLPSLAFASFDTSLGYGSSGSAVLSLQQFLIQEGLLPTNDATGNFFSLTRAAVQQFQTQQGITPAAGFFGPITRARASAIASDNTSVYVTPTVNGTSTTTSTCADPTATNFGAAAACTYSPTSTTPTAPSNSVNFTATPTSGSAPLIVTFSRASFAAPIVGSQAPTSLDIAAQNNILYGINFGDGTAVSGFQISCPSTSSGAVSGTTCAPSVTHTYNTPGTYTAELLYHSYASLQAACANVNSSSGCPAAASLLQPINSLTITATGSGTNQPSATIDQSIVQTSTDSANDTVIPPFTGTATGVSKVNVVVIETADLASTAYESNTWDYLPNPVPIVFPDVPVQNGTWQTEILLPNGSWGGGSIAYGELPIPNSSLTVLVYDDSNGQTAALGEAPLVQKQIAVQLAQTTVTAAPVALSCPLYTLSTCTNGTLVAQGKDANGCQLPPQCVPNSNSNNDNGPTPTPPTSPSISCNATYAPVPTSQLATYKGTPVTPDATWSVVATGDFADNGNTDFLWRQSTTGTLSMWLMNGISVIASSEPPTYQGNVITPDSTWNVVATGDFTGNGNDDILWRQSTTGTLAMWLMNGATITATETPTYQGNVITPDSTWNVVGTGDFNGDGKTDILWSQSTTGMLAGWEMDGSVITASITPTFSGSVPPNSTFTCATASASSSGNNPNLANALTALRSALQAFLR